MSVLNQPYDNYELIVVDGGSKDDNEVGAAVCKEIHIDEFFITDLKEYMEYYNNERIKLRLNGMSPDLCRKAFEQAHSY